MTFASIHAGLWVVASYHDEFPGIATTPKSEAPSVAVQPGIKGSDVTTASPILPAVASIPNVVPRFSEQTTVKIEPVFALAVAKKEKTQSVYQVKAGDTLSHIAREHHVAIETIAQANGIQDLNMIVPGIDLYIPQQG